MGRDVPFLTVEGMGTASSLAIYLGTQWYGQDSPWIDLHHPRQGKICPQLCDKRLGKRFSSFCRCLAFSKKFFFSTRSQK